MLTGPLAFELPAFLLGLLLGSFLNVCISRLPGRQSILKPRSHCPDCLRTLAWYDNIPILSWILLHGRCRHCGKPIAWRYPLVEIGFAFWLTFAARTAFPLLKPGLPLNTVVNAMTDAAGLAILGFLLLGLLVMDWQTHTLPDAFTLSGSLIGLLLTCVRAAYLLPHQYDLLLHGPDPLTSVGGAQDQGNIVLTGPEHLILGRLYAMVLLAGILLFIRIAYKTLRKREGLGMGDIKLAAMMAAFLGFWLGAFAVFLGVILCAAYAGTLIARRRATATTRLPLGTFLCIGGLIAAILGAPVIAWYASLF
jgi:leader peptidase (prepilin peptidase)/N-methyltransferase